MDRQCNATLLQCKETREALYAALTTINRTNLSIFIYLFTNLAIQTLFTYFLQTFPSANQGDPASLVRRAFHWSGPRAGGPAAATSGAGRICGGTFDRADRPGTHERCGPDAPRSGARCAAERKRRENSG
jgi:hypothetical protein